MDNGERGIDAKGAIFKTPALTPPLTHNRRLAQSDDLRALWPSGQPLDARGMRRRGQKGAVVVILDKDNKNTGPATRRFANAAFTTP